MRRFLPRWIACVGCLVRLTRTLSSPSLTVATESATQQEELLKDTCVRERDMRKAAERDKAFALGAKSELEEELHTRQAELHHLQTLLQQAAEAHQGAPEAYHGYRTSGRVLV